MTLIDDSPARTEPHRNGAEICAPAANLRTAATRADPEANTTAASASDGAMLSDARRHALWFHWMWLLFATVVSIGGSVIHAWMTAPITHMKLLAAAAAAVPPAVLLGTTHSVALLIKTRRRGYRRIDAVVLAAAMVLNVGVAGCAFAMSFLSLRDLMILLGISTATAWLWPIAVDLSLICSTLALLTLTSPPRDGRTFPRGTAPAAAVNNGPSSPAERRLWWESIAAVVQQQNSDVRKVAGLPTAKIAEILERLYDKADSQRAICADAELHHREVRTIKQTTDEVLARITTASPVF